MCARDDLIQWHVREVRCHRGGQVLVPAAQVPFGRLLPYRRAAGEQPRAGCAGLVRSRGWIADLGQRGTSELLLGLAAAAALQELTPGVPLHYDGPEAKLMRRCGLPVESSEHTWGPHVIRTATRSPVRFRIDPAESPAWLDEVEPGQMEVHSALPMRHYLAIEQRVGQRLSRDATPAPVFPSLEKRVPWHVVFVTTPGWPRHLDFRVDDFAEVASELMAANPSAPWRFTVITGRNSAVPPVFDGLPADVLCDPPAGDCVDLFASADLVVGTDVGLTQLAALCTRPDGTTPQVVVLHARSSYTKWTTGSANQHAVATRFAQMLAFADRTAEPAELADPAWIESASLRRISRFLVAEFASNCAGWR
ncbi:glycosyl transferase family 9 [Saccharopolyspora taberi]|uniref:Uncharacterized protein n=1 Tax=Saccharopolyspora taberi TaxID=60895 RepID=A0ABN3V2M6_9PSEU